MKKKKLTNSEEIAKLYTDTYRTRMPLYNDYVFHRIYGSDTEESKAALVGLLNIILERKDDPIRRLEIKNPIDIGDWILDKDTTMDIKAETDSGELLTIEMQVSHLTDYRSTFADCTIESLVKEHRMDLAGEAAKILFT